MNTQRQGKRDDDDSGDETISRINLVNINPLFLFLFFCLPLILATLSLFLLFSFLLMKCQRQRKRSNENDSLPSSTLFFPILEYASLSFSGVEEA
jgi:hypothetical protein